MNKPLHQYDENNWAVMWEILWEQTDLQINGRLGTDIRTQLWESSALEIRESLIYEQANKAIY